MGRSEPTRRQFLTSAGILGAAAAAAQLGLTAAGGSAWARARVGSSMVPPITPTIPPVAARHALKRLTTPLPPWIHNGPTSRPRIAISIDDMWGAFGADNASAAMDVAKAKGVKLSFFPTGGALEDHINLGRQALWQRAVAEGHDIGNHTYTHTQLPKLTDDQIRGELTHTRDLLAQCLGTVPYTMRMMRPPGGGGGFVTGGDPRIMNVLTGMGYSMAMWSIDANGVKGNAAFINKILANATNGSIVLFHFTEFTPDGMSTLIDRLRSDKKLEPTSITGLFS